MKRPLLLVLVFALSSLGCKAIGINWPGGGDKTPTKTTKTAASNNTGAKERTKKAKPSHADQSKTTRAASNSASAPQQSVEPAGPRGWFNPSEVVLYEGRLYFTLWVVELERSHKVSIEISGPGADGAVVKGEADSRSNFVCAGVNITDDSIGWNLDKDCSFGIDAQAGTYTLVAKVDGNEVARHDIPLVEGPAYGGKTALGVDPQGRFHQAYHHPGWYVVWVPITGFSRGYSVGFFQEGRFVDAKHGGVEDRMKRVPDRALFGGAPIGFDLPRDGDNSKPWQIVVVADGKELIGAWTVQHLDDGSVDGVAFARGKRFGPLNQEMKPSKEMLDRLQKEGERGLGRYLIGKDSDSEQATCAALASADVVALGEKRAEVWHNKSQLWEWARQKQSVIDDRHATRSEKTNAKATLKSTKKQIKLEEGRLKKIDATLDKARAKYKPGCLA